MEGAIRTSLSQPLVARAPRTASGGKIRASRLAPGAAARNLLYHIGKIRHRGQPHVGAPILANIIGNLVADGISSRNNTATPQTGTASNSGIAVQPGVDPNAGSHWDGETDAQAPARELAPYGSVADASAVKVWNVTTGQYKWTSSGDGPASSPTRWTDDSHTQIEANPDAANTQSSAALDAIMSESQNAPVDLGGVDKFEPVSGGGEMDHSKEAAGKLVVAGGDGAVDLELSKHAFDAIALLVERPIILDLHAAV